MDNRTFTTRLSAAARLDLKETRRLALSLGAIMADCAMHSHDVAIPGFGTFESVKIDEHVVTDTVTGRKTLMPPSIDVTFKAGSRLKKAIAK